MATMGDCECQHDAHFDPGNGWHRYRDNSTRGVVKVQYPGLPAHHKCLGCLQHHSHGAVIVGEPIILTERGQL